MSEQTPGYDPRTDPDSDQYDPDLGAEPDEEEGVDDDFDPDEEIDPDDSDDPGEGGTEGTEEGDRKSVV